MKYFRNLYLVAMVMAMLCLSMPVLAAKQINSINNPSLQPIPAQIHADISHTTGTVTQKAQYINNGTQTPASTDNNTPIQSGNNSGSSNIVIYFLLAIVLIVFLAIAFLVWLLFKGGKKN